MHSASRSWIPNPHVAEQVDQSLSVQSYDARSYGRALRKSKQGEVVCEGEDVAVADRVDETLGAPPKCHKNWILPPPGLSW